MHAVFKISLAFILLPGAAYAQSAQSAAPSSGSGSALESAKKGLSALPAIGRESGVTGKAPKFELPSIAPALVPSGPSAPPDRSTLPPASGPTWLLDGLTQTDAENSARRTTSYRSDPNAPGEASARATSADPLANYLTQWLTPRDLAILRPDIAASTAKSAENPFEPEHALELERAGGVDRGEPSFRAVAPVGFAPNPYVENLTRSPNVSAFSPQDVPGVPAPGETRALPVTNARSGLSAPSTPMFKPAPAAATPAPPPAGPIVNDRKYFPQLRRF